MFAFLSFLKVIPLKVWFYLAIALAYPALYFLGHHKGYVQGVADTDEKYIEANKKAEAEAKKKEDKDRAQALKDNEGLRKQLAQNESSKKDLESRLKNALAKKPIDNSCPAVEPDNFRLLQDAVDQANK